MIRRAVVGPDEDRREPNRYNAACAAALAALADDIAMAMEAIHVRIVAPIPGKGVVGIEVSNPKTTVVYLREIIECDEWKNNEYALPLALGFGVTSGMPRPRSPVSWRYHSVACAASSALAPGAA